MARQSVSVGSGSKVFMAGRDMTVDGFLAKIDVREAVTIDGIDEPLEDCILEVRVVRRASGMPARTVRIDRWELKISGTVGDVVVNNGTLKVKDDVRGDVHVSNGNISVGGGVGGNCKAIGGSVSMGERRRRK